MLPNDPDPEETPVGKLAFWLILLGIALVLALVGALYFQSAMDYLRTRWYLVALFLLLLIVSVIVYLKLKF